MKIVRDFAPAAVGGGTPVSFLGDLIIVSHFFSFFFLNMTTVPCVIAAYVTFYRVCLVKYRYEIVLHKMFTRSW